MRDLQYDEYLKIRGPAIEVARMTLPPPEFKKVLEELTEDERTCKRRAVRRLVEAVEGGTRAWRHNRD